MNKTKKTTIKIINNKFLKNTINIFIFLFGLIFIYFLYILEDKIIKDLLSEITLNLLRKKELVKTYNELFLLYEYQLKNNLHFEEDSELIIRFKKKDQHPLKITKSILISTLDYFNKEVDIDHSLLKNNPVINMNSKLVILTNNKQHNLNVINPEKIILDDVTSITEKVNKAVSEKYGSVLK